MPRIHYLIVLWLPFLMAASSPTPSIATLVEKGHFKRAQVVLAEQLKQNPDDAELNYRMSKVSVAYKRWDEAVAQAEKAVAADGKRSDYHAQLADALVSKLGESTDGMFAKLSLASRFRKEAELVLQLDPRNRDTNEDLVQYYLEAPGLAGGGKKKADELAESLMRSDAGLGNFLKGEIAAHEKQTAEAGRFYQKAVEAAPGDYVFHVALANYDLNQGGASLGSAEEQAQKAIKLDADRIGAYTSLAMVYAKQGRWKECDGVLAEAERHVPDDFVPYYQAAKTILLAGDSKELSRAENYLRKYLSQPPEGGEPPLSAAHWRLGLVLEKEGRKDDARNEMQMSVNLDPGFKEAQKDLKRLR